MGPRDSHTVERALVSDVVNEENAHRAAIISRRDGAETLLASGIPNLELDALSIELNGPDLEVNTDGGDEGGGEGVLAEAQETA